jgi:hypothetical protein
MCETETSGKPLFCILRLYQNFVKVEIEKIHSPITIIIRYINVGTQCLRTRKLARMEESEQSELFIELLRSAICQRYKNNLMTVSNGQIADLVIFVKSIVFEGFWTS